MRIPRPNFAGSNYTNYHSTHLQAPRTPMNHLNLLDHDFNMQRVETFTRTLRFNGLKPFIDSKGNQHTYLPEGIDEDQLPDADTAFKQGRDSYKAFYNAFYTAAFIGDIRMVARFLLKNYDPKISKSTPGIRTDCTPSSKYRVPKSSQSDNLQYQQSHWWSSGLKGKTILELAELGKHDEIVQMILVLDDKTMSEWKASDDQDKYKEIEQMLNAYANPAEPETHAGHKALQLLRQIRHWRPNRSKG